MSCSHRILRLWARQYFGYDGDNPPAIALKIPGHKQSLIFFLLKTFIEIILLVTNRKYSHTNYQICKVNQEQKQIKKLAAAFLASLSAAVYFISCTCL